MKYTFNKGERLKSRKLIELLFEKGKRLKSFPIQLIYTQIEHDSDYLLQVGFSVPKRLFKRAVDRNKLKRLMREAYRLNKHSLLEKQEKKYTKKHILMFIYSTGTILPYRDIEKKIRLLLEDFNDLFIKENE